MLFLKFSIILIPVKFLDVRAVAEHRIVGKKVDLCFVNDKMPKDPVQVEFKFQFS